MQFEKTKSELNELLPVFQNFFDEQIDQADCPASENILDTVISHMMNTGEWLVVESKETGKILGIVYFLYLHPNRDAMIQVHPMSPDFSLIPVVRYIFGLGKGAAPHKYFKIKAYYPVTDGNMPLFLDAGFEPRGLMRQDVLLGGRLFDRINYECFHPLWGKQAGQEIEE